MVGLKRNSKNFRIFMWILTSICLVGGAAAATVGILAILGKLKPIKDSASKYVNMNATV